jgi:hypothetical protein
VEKPPPFFLVCFSIHSCHFLVLFCGSGALLDLVALGRVVGGVHDGGSTVGWTSVDGFLSMGSDAIFCSV